MARQLDPHRAPGRRPPTRVPESDSPVVACPPSDPRPHHPGRGAGRVGSHGPRRGRPHPRPLRWQGGSTRAPQPVAGPADPWSLRWQGSSTRAAQPVAGPADPRPLRWQGGSARAAHRGAAAIRPDRPETPPACPPRVASPARRQPAAVLATGRQALPPSGPPDRWRGSPPAGARPTDPRGGAGARPTIRRVDRSTRQRFPRPTARVATSVRQARQPGRRSVPAGRAGGHCGRWPPTSGRRPVVASPGGGPPRAGGDRRVKTRG